jgi:hypothetical protein
MGFEQSTEGDFEGNVNKWEQQQRFQSALDENLKKWLNKKEFETATFDDAKKKVLELIYEFSGFLGSLEKKKPEDTAKFYADYWQPAIDDVRQADNFTELSLAFRKIDMTKLTERHYELVRKWGFLRSAEPFPTDTQECKDFIKARSKLDLLASFEAGIE